jgi:hypothetical protein
LKLKQELKIIKFSQKKFQIKNKLFYFINSYKVAPASNVEKGVLADYDPFKERKVEHPTSDMDTLTHLLKVRRK